MSLHGRATQLQVNDREKKYVIPHRRKNPSDKHILNGKYAGPNNIENRPNILDNRRPDINSDGGSLHDNIQTHSNSDRRNRFDPTEAVTLAKKNFTGNCSDRHNRHEHNNNFDRQNWPHHNRYRDDRHTGDYCTNIERPSSGEVQLHTSVNKRDTSDKTNHDSYTQQVSGAYIPPWRWPALK